MALVNRSFQLDITPGAIPQVVKVSEYDQNREYTVTLIDEGGEYEIPSGTTAAIEGTIGDSGFSETAAISGDTITFTLMESMTAKAGDVWCKIKLVKDSKPIQTCAFILRCDRAGVEADTIIGAPGFQEQINEGIAEYFDNDPPFFELPSGGQSGQALLSDGSNGAYWGQAQGGGSGLTDEVKSALMNVASHIGAWTDGNAQTYIQALHDALYPPANLSFITAVFAPGQNVIYTTDTLDTLKQYLTVTAHYSDSSTQTVTSYTLSGTLTVGTSTVTVSYGGKTTTFNVTVTKASTDLVFTVGGSDPSTDADTTSTARYKSARIPVNSDGDNSYPITADITVDGAKGWWVIRSYDANGDYLGPMEVGDVTPINSGSNGGWARADGTQYVVNYVNRDSAKVAQTRFIRFIIRNNNDSYSGGPISTFSGTVTVDGKTYDVVQQ